MKESVYKREGRHRWTGTVNGSQGVRIDSDREVTPEGELGASEEQI